MFSIHVKENTKSLKKEEMLSIFLILVFFSLATLFAQQYGYLLKELPYLEGPFGAFLYVSITVLAVVAAPISTFPLLPVAVSLWGSFLAAVLSIVGWTIGASIAFGLARRYGKPLIRKMVSLEKIQRIEKMIPEENIFMSVVLLRMTLPVDILSYALGLFSGISFRNYFLATLIGVSPFAFFFAYAIELPSVVQFFVVALVLILLASGYARYNKR